MQTGDEVILLYVILPKEQWEQVKLPKGCFAKAYEIGPIEDMCQVQNCRSWGAIIAAAMNRLAKKLCPDYSNLILSPTQLDN